LTDKEKEKEKILTYSQNIGVSMSEVIQDWIKALPDSKRKKDGE